MSSVSQSTQTEQSILLPPEHVFGSHAIQGDPPVRDPKNVTLAFESLTFPCLVKRLDPTQEGEYDPTVITQVLLYSIRLLPQAKNVFTATKAGLHTHLAQLIQDSSSNVTVRNRRQAAECFMLISKQAVGRTALCASTDALDSLRTLNCDEETSVRQFSMLAMSELATVQEGANTLTEREFIQHFAERAKVEQDSMAKRLALHIIHSCCKQNKQGACAQAFAAGVVETAVEVLKNHSVQEEEVLAQTIKLIRVLGEQFDNKVEVIDKDAVPVLLETLKNGRMSLSAQGSVCGALGLLSTEKDGKLQIIENGMDIFASILREACKNPKAPHITTVVMSTVQLLATMCSYPPARQQCLDNGIPEAISYVQETFSDERHLIRAIKVCRKNLVGE
eukprot:gb/GECG01000206.1/.p1 GENE.gb/GECG01000206.1/~~gb/GECG01000206.1/.p1  ORF type:complete len:391 (+),score=41.70 gb/GECG01000206.1/:1-1173(+)